jgi:transposase-like protein
MRKRPTFTPEFKAQVVLAQLLGRATRQIEILKKAATSSPSGCWTV